jgi:hypothetical protein
LATSVKIIVDAFTSTTGVCGAIDIVIAVVIGRTKDVDAITIVAGLSLRALYWRGIADTGIAGVVGARITIVAQRIVGAGAVGAAVYRAVVTIVTIDVSVLARTFHTGIVGAGIVIIAVGIFGAGSSLFALTGFGVAGLAFGTVLIRFTRIGFAFTGFAVAGLALGTFDVGAGAFAGRFVASLGGAGIAVIFALDGSEVARTIDTRVGGAVDPVIAVGIALATGRNAFTRLGVALESSITFDVGEDARSRRFAVKNYAGVGGARIVVITFRIHRATRNFTGALVIALFALGAVHGVGALAGLRVTCVVGAILTVIAVIVTVARANGPTGVVFLTDETFVAGRVTSGTRIRAVAVVSTIQWRTSSRVARAVFVTYLAFTTR